MGLMDWLLGIEKKKDVLSDDVSLEDMYDDLVDTEDFHSEDFDNDENDLYGDIDD